jgi:SAM-dependent methyltransferase
MVGPPELWDMKRRFQFTFLEGAGLRPSDRLLDIGCGTLRGGIPLIAHLEPGHYTGLDVRAEALAEAREELRAAGLCDKTPRLLEIGALDSLELSEHFDVIWAFSVLIHMGDAVLEGCLSFVSRHLAESGVFYANVNLGTRSAGSWMEFPCIWRELGAYRKLAERCGLRVESLGPLGDLGHDSGRAAHDEQHMLKFTRADAPTRSGGCAAGRPGAGDAAQ